MENSTPRILVLADIDRLDVKLGDVLEKNDSGKYFVLNRKSDGTRPSLYPRPEIIRDIEVIISPDMFGTYASVLKNVSLPDESVRNITAIREVQKDDSEYVTFLRKFVNKAPCEKPNNSGCVVSGGRKRTARRKHPRRKNRRRSTTRK